MYDTEIPNYGEVMTVQQFQNCVDQGLFIDYDGVGEPVKNGLADRKIEIRPSKCPKCIPADATHIVWFNR